jgi:hypothetical protein
MLARGQGFNKKKSSFLSLFSFYNFSFNLSFLYLSNHLKIGRLHGAKVNRY